MSAPPFRAGAGLPLTLIDSSAKVRESEAQCQQTGAAETWRDADGWKGQKCRQSARAETNKQTKNFSINNYTYNFYF